MKAEVCRGVVVNKASCASLLSSTVARTASYNVDRLLRLHHQMSLMIYRHRHDYDKKALLQVTLTTAFCVFIFVWSVIILKHKLRFPGHQISWVIEYVVFLHGLAELWRPQKKLNSSQR